MVAWKKWVVKRPPVTGKFKAFKSTVKNVKHLQAIVKKNKALQGVIKTIFSKKAVKVTALATVVGVGISYIDNYIQSNSGCFLHSGSSVCKVKALSCCQPEAVDKVPFCPDQTLENTCNGYNEDVEKTCCRLCDCQYYNCLPHQRMECQRPTIAEALSYYAQEMTSSVWSAFMFLIPWLTWVVGTGIALLVIWIAWNVYKKTRLK
ncbi:uncharacterized protein TNCV_3651791 [Trichonephila clavipes]|uniref:Uncharacterized protein n=1 Tax=Trichonephila clavipes TaxID=2585209 RepID=A0A8X6S2Q0_TRICX|nr:uncharacterized protein TNCV_4345491 [Trichonephila clavipes]GFS69058.1 uncharacterized protein TNCV_4570461 [Trichonephila clavipes]GFW11073.1 uncharacterized protein TNCV_276051 [Trichonephila clavipes]GFX57392.1 uncharacterized protein TNCV_3138111 [Trichonephila clavipes]GFY06392.1 uncharacterized protein TNCV_3651791 [Trichonephila clavipes]